MQTTDFTEMNLSDEVQRAISEIGFEEATNIQTQSIPLILAGKDVIGHSQTGTGKTAAFSIPAIEKIDITKNKSTQVLILCPTRELAVQACDEIRKFAKYKHNIKTIPIYGGQQIDRQLTALRAGAQNVVGTPGRIMDHMRRGTLKLNELTMAVLDEADEMLSMGFREDIETILSASPKERQTILFSATISPEILKITREFQRNPKIIKVTHEQLTVPQIEQLYYEVPMGKKVEVLSRLLDVYNPKRSIIFCNTKSKVDELVSELQLRGYSSGGLHGDMKQASRTQMMNSFKSGNIDMLVATDVAARGIDVDNIEAVFNYDIPQDVEYYVHRIGRTGRAGKEGRSFSFVSGRRQINELIQIEKFIKTKIQLRAIPSSAEVMEKKANLIINEISRVINDENLEQYNQIADKLLKEFEPVDISKALLRMLINKEGQATSNDDLFARESVRIKAERLKPERRRKSAGATRSSGKIHNDQNMINIFISIGRKNRVSANHILSAVAGASGLPGKIFGRIEILDDYTLIGVPKETAEVVLTSLQGAQIMGRKIHVKKV